MTLRLPFVAPSWLALTDGWLNLSTLSEVYPSTHQGRIDTLTSEWVEPPCWVVYTAGSGDEPARVLCGEDADKLLSALEAARVD